MILQKNEYYYLAVLTGVFTALVVGSGGHEFFWDTIQFGPRHALYFYENPGTFLLPEDIDSGHIPLFGYYLSILWRITSPTLFVSHLAMLPFVAGIVWSSFFLIRLFIPSRHCVIAHIIFLIDPVLLTQITLVSPDVPLICFFLLSLFFILKNKRYLLALSLTALAATSNRGILSAVALWCFDLLQNRRHISKGIIPHLLNQSAAYLPAAGLVAGFFIFHYHTTGWILYHRSSPWAPSYEYAGTLKILSNLLIVAWRMIDFGRILLWLFIITLFIKSDHKKLFTAEGKILINLFAIIMFMFLLATIPYKHLTAHRYYLPASLTFCLIVLNTVYRINQPMLIRRLFSILAPVALLSGHWWIYPEGIAMGWDSTLAHIPYYKLRREMITYIDRHAIRPEDIGTAFPLTSQFRYSDLSKRTESFAVKDLKKNKYILYSNLMNDFTPAERHNLNSNWVCIYEVAKCKIFIRLYARKEK